MNYKIIKEIHDDGIARFYPQKRVFFFWKNYMDYTIGTEWLIAVGCEVPCIDERKYTFSITKAKEYIINDHNNKCYNRFLTILYNDRIIFQRGKL